MDDLEPILKLLRQALMLADKADQPVIAAQICVSIGNLEEQLHATLRR